MTLSLDFFPQSDSVVRHLDPRWKMAAVLIAGVGVVLLQTLPAGAAALLVAVLLVVVSRLPARWYLARVGAVGIFLALFAVFLPFVVPGTVTLRVGPVSLSLAGSIM